MKKTLSLILALVTLASAMASCSRGDTSAETTASDTQSAETTPALTDDRTTPEYIPDDLPDDLDYNGEGVHILGWNGDGQTEFFVEAQDGDIVNDAIFTRNSTVEERLNIELSYTLLPGDNSKIPDWIKSASNSIMAGDGAYDIIGGYSMGPANLAYNRLIIDLADSEYLDFSKPWWPESLLNEAVCDGRLYFASGDISTNMIYMLYATFFNKKLTEAYDIDNLYQLVRDGEWTIDKMTEMSEAVYNDINGDGAKDSGDSFGFVTHTTFSDSLYFSSGLSITDLDSDGIPVISEDFKGEKAQALLEKLIGIFDRNGLFLGKDYDEVHKIFTDGRGMFYLTEVDFAVSYLRDTEIDYGVLPVPKGDEAMDEYRSCTSFPYTLYCIPIDATDYSMSSAIMECLASESYRAVSPALFETALKVKYASDDDASEMYDIIRSGAVFDFGRIFVRDLGNVTATKFRYSVRDRNPNWFSTYESMSSSLETKFDAIIEALTEDIG